MSLNYSSLASAVILQAFNDLNVVRCSKESYKLGIRMSAREFLLEPNEDLAFWCLIGGIDQKAIVAKARVECGIEPLEVS